MRPRSRFFSLFCPFSFTFKIPLRPRKSAFNLNSLLIDEIKSFSFLYKSILNIGHVLYLEYVLNWQTPKIVNNVDQKMCNM